MKIYFDVDFTLRGVDGSPRPNIRAVFERLVEEGHQVYLWSGMSDPRHIIEDFELGGLVSGCFRKPIEDHHYELERLNIPTPDFCVDDNQEIIDVFGGYTLPPYLYTDLPDDHMWRAYHAFSQHVARAQKNGDLSE